MQDRLSNIKSAILGHAVGDALGVPVEFQYREDLEKNPVTSMRGFGTFPYPAGTWSDDTSMTLATLDSLANGIDYHDLMTKFCEWLEHAKYTPAGVTFGVGGSTKKSLLVYLINDEPALKCGQKHEWDNGNGSLMRIVPLVLYLFYSELNKLPIDEKMTYVHNVSALTHAHSRAKIGCGIYAFVLTELLLDKSREAVYRGISKAAEFYANEPEAEKYSRILTNDIAVLSRKDICGSGYVVDCLESALWCLLTTDNYRDCVLKAVNLGEDTDTTAAVAGGLAGVMYGYSNIPQEWIDTLIKRDYIEELCENAALKWMSTN